MGDTWFLISKDDSWSLLARHLTPDDLKLFNKIAINVLTIPDPRFDLPQNEQWMANALGHESIFSDLIREGLSDTLAIMGDRGDDVPSIGCSPAD